MELSRVAGRDLECIRDFQVVRVLRDALGFTKQEVIRSKKG